MMPCCASVRMTMLASQPMMPPTINVIIKPMIFPFLNRRAKPDTRLNINVRSRPDIVSTMET